ncbi:MAG TPA: peptidoglycan DD-metalloendopeptidase family protein [Alphaproteobacteria bacterium]|nr:peptidoglycan DD-metalloendopeptidase family protein [Alphaproteobacteria bacterium]
MAASGIAPRLMIAAALGIAGSLLSSCGWMAVPPPRHASGSAAASYPPAPPGSVTVQPGDTLYAIARRNNTPIRAIIDANSLSPPYLLRPGQQLVVPHPQVHVVKAGDTLYSIARQSDTDMSAIVRANDIKPPYRIRTGETLIMPGRVTAEPPAAQPASPGEIRKVETLPPSGGIPAKGPQPLTSTTSPSTSPGGITVTQLPPPPTLSPQVASGSTPASPLPPPSGSDAKAAPPPALSPAAGAAAVEPPPPPVAAGPKLASLPPASETPAEAPEGGGNGRFLWPIRGKIISGFGAKEDGLYNDGINIAARAGETVVAADSGVVVYAGNEIRGFGNLVLIKHDNGWMTAYAHNETLLVKRGQRVRRGQPIAKAGSSGSVSSPQLHFEVRHGSRAVDPLKYLGSLSS